MRRKRRGINPQDSIKGNADIYAANLHDLIIGYQTQGKSLNEMARQLNKIGVATARGGRWYAKSVSNLVKRLNN